MFRPLPMQRLELLLLREHLPHAALALAESGAFQPDPASHAELDDPPGEGYRHLFHEARTRLDKILAHFELGPADLGATTEPHVITVSELEETNGELGVLWASCSEWQEDMREVEEERKSVDDLMTALDTFARLKVDLDQLHGRRPGNDRHFLNLRIGAVPKNHTRRLGEALGLAGHLLQVFQIRGPTAFVVVAGLSDGGRVAQVESVLETAGFHAVEVPEEFVADGHTDAASIRARLLARQRDADAEWQRLHKLRRLDRAELRERLAGLAGVLALAGPWAGLSPLVGARGGLAMIHGWAPRDAIATIRTHLDARLPDAWVLSQRDPGFGERDITPVIMPRPVWLRSFTSLVRNFGVPRYGEIDPTAFFTLSFLLLFGMMFGDVGHGAVIAATGLWLWHRGGPGLAMLPILAGGASMLFGLLYGSIFGYEHLLPALWMSPMHDPILMMTLAAWLGIGFLSLTTLLNIANRIIDRDWPGALLAGNGLAGLVFYLGLVAVVTTALNGRPLPAWAIALLLGAPGLTFIARQWQRSEGGVGERIMITAIEAFETAMGYISGTLSFLRVAAFGLNHVALAIAVFTLADMLGDVGHWLMVIGGNIFILVLEGAIVAIQVLRLEYYEGFSRFFGGNGRAFRPLTLNPAPNPG